MQRLPKLAGLGAAALLAVALSTPAFAFSATSGTVLDIAADPAPGTCAVERIWAQQNDNLVNPTLCPTTGVGSCLPAPPLNAACPRTWLSNVQASTRGGYQSHTENSSGFPGWTENGTMYILWEQVTNRATGNYVGYYHLASALNSTGKLSKVVDNNCVGTVSTSCFLPGYAARNTGPDTKTRILNTNLGGFSATPSPKIQSAAATISMNWRAAQSFNEAGAIAPSVRYKVYRFHDANGNNTCEPPAENAPGWVLIAPLVTSTTFTDTTPPVGGDCIFYALRLNLAGPALTQNGPDAGPGELTASYLGASSQAVSRNPAASQVVNFISTYVGKMTIRSSWTLATQGTVTGFYVTRANEADGTYTRVSPLIPATGDNTNYSFDDKVTRKNGLTFYYKLESMTGDQVQATSGSSSVTLKPAKN